MIITDSIVPIGIAAALGLLVGLQRERTQTLKAGLRTFALATMFGAILTLIAQETQQWWMAAAGLLTLSGILISGHVARLREDRNSGLTTEVAALVMFSVGVLLALGHLALGVVIGGAVAVLLQLKQPLRNQALALSDSDFTAIMRFVLITLVILPVLPATPFGPYGVMNLRETWLMVVLIVGIGLGGYVLLKLFGGRAGTLLGGALGGLISSTATTVSYARSSRSAPETSSMAVMVVMLATLVSMLRVLMLVGAITPNSLATLAPPLAIFAGLFVILWLVSWSFSRTTTAHVAEHSNPAELRPALIFGALYALVTLSVAAVKDWFGTSGLYPVAVISGLTDLDAIALSTARMIDKNQLSVDLGWRLIMVATMSNLLFKGGVAMMLGSRALGWRVAMYFGVGIVGGGMILWLWV